MAGWPLFLEAMALSVQSSVGLSSTGESVKFSVFVDWVADPAALGIVADSGVEWINKDNFEVFVGGILANPV